MGVDVTTLLGTSIVILSEIDIVGAINESDSAFEELKFDNSKILALSWSFLTDIDDAINETEGVAESLTIGKMGTFLFGGVWQLQKELFMSRLSLFR